jgi:hypothetical protein
MQNKAPAPHPYTTTPHSPYTSSKTPDDESLGEAETNASQSSAALDDAPTHDIRRVKSHPTAEAASFVVCRDQS